MAASSVASPQELVNRRALREQQRQGRMQSPPTSAPQLSGKSSGQEKEDWSLISMVIEALFAPTKVSNPLSVITRVSDIVSGRVSFFWGAWKAWIEAHKIPWVKATVALELKVLFWVTLFMIVVVVVGLVLSCIAGGLTSAISCAAKVGFGGSSALISVLWAL